MTMRRSKRRSHSAYGQGSCDSCIRKLRQTLEKFRGVADITCALAVQMATLRKLREAVQKAEAATARTAKQRHHETISTACRAKADAPEMQAHAIHRLVTRRDNDAFPRSVARAADVTLSEHRHEAHNGTTKTKALPGRLFMQSQWR